MALRELHEETTPLVVELSVPFMSNDAAHISRMTKLHRKIGGCLQSGEHGLYLAAIRSYIATARKHGAGALRVLGLLSRHEPWMPPVIT